MSQFWPFLFFFCSATLMRVAKSRAPNAQGASPRKRKSRANSQSTQKYFHLSSMRSEQRQLFKLMCPQIVCCTVQGQVGSKEDGVCCRAAHSQNEVLSSEIQLVRCAHTSSRLCHCLTRRSVPNADVSVLLNDGREIRCIADGETILATAVSIIIRDHRNSQPLDLVNEYNHLELKYRPCLIRGSGSEMGLPIKAKSKSSTTNTGLEQ